MNLLIPNHGIDVTADESIFFYDFVTLFLLVPSVMTDE